jgi:hypothetical protein
LQRKRKPFQDVVHGYGVLSDRRGEDVSLEGAYHAIAERRSEERSNPAPAGNPATTVKRGTAGLPSDPAASCSRTGGLAAGGGLFRCGDPTVLVYLNDVPPSHPDFAAVQARALRGELPGWTLHGPATAEAHR